MADFDEGQTLGIGFAGAAWDYGFSRASLGAYVGNPTAWGGSWNSRIKAGTRAQWRFLDDTDLKLASILGAEYDPGPVGGRSYLVPDLGIGVAYRFTWNDLPLVVRFNVSLTVDQGQADAYPLPVASSGLGLSEPPRGNVFQRLTFGPSTMIGVGFAATDRYELTLGGGTLVGLRIHY